MSSVTLNGVRFSAYLNDHAPRHVHGLFGCTRVIVELLPSGDVDLAKRKNVIRPRGAKKSDVRKILSLAAAHFDELTQLWEQNHGET